MAAGPEPSGDPGTPGERWRDAVAELDYAERHGASATDVEDLAARVIAARIELVQAGVRGGAELPAFLQAALERDRRLLEDCPPPNPPVPRRAGDGR